MGWDRQVRTGRNQKSDGAVCKTTLACSTLGSSGAMLIVVMSVKSMKQSVAMSSVEFLRGASTGQGTWQCSVPAEFIDAEQMTELELIALKKMPHTTLDGQHHN